MSWNRESILSEQREQVLERHGECDRAALLEEIVRLRAALYPLVVTLSSLDDKAPRGVMATSKLFPADLGKGEDGGKFAVYDEATRDFAYSRIAGHEFHLHEYELAESEHLMNGTAGQTRMHDDVSVFAVHSYWIGAYAFCGEITMGDVRHAAGQMWPRRDGAAGEAAAGDAG